MSEEITVVKNKAELIIKKDYINVLRNNEPKYGVLFTDFIIATITKRSRRMGEEYMVPYITLVDHIKDFESLYSAVIYTNSVNEDFLEDFIIYLESIELKQTYIKGLLTNAKGMARKAGEYGYAVDPSYDEVDIDDEEAFSIYLSINEITRIYYFMGLSRKQQRIRDLFVLGCMTALRYSDYSTLEFGNLGSDSITKKTKKTGKKVTIPMHYYVKEIIDRYNRNITFGLSNQHFNRYVKKICQQVGLTESITYQYTRGGKVVSETKEKWQLISSHTARRSAITNMLLSGLKPYQIMPISGHTTEKSLFRYVKLTYEDIANQMSGSSFFNK